MRWLTINRITIWDILESLERGDIEEFTQGVLTEEEGVFIIRKYIEDIKMKNNFLVDNTHKR